VVERSGTFRIWMRKNNAACNPTGVQELLVVSSSGGVVACAPQPPATGFDASGIFFQSKHVVYDREEYKKVIQPLLPEALTTEMT